VKRETLCVHAGARADSAQPGLTTPTYTSTAYEYLDTDVRPYQRYFNTANQAVVADKLAVLEGAEEGIVFSSGMAAISTVLLTFLRAGEHAIVQADLYGGTTSFIVKDFPRFDIEYTVVQTDPEAVRAAVRRNTKVVLIESPTNPLLRIMDLAAVATIARSRRLVSIIDNTFATPINQTPIGYGIDIVVHSGTKFLGGHSDLQCGAALGSQALMRRVRHTATHLGGSLNAVSCSLLERSLKTLALRVERQTQNAGKVAEWLAGHASVKAVHYPGLASHPGHDIAKRQMAGFGSMLAFELVRRADAARQFMKRLRLIKPALSLGGVESTVCDPATTSHQKVDATTRRRMGISDNLLRLSIGIEHADDLIADLQQALQQTPQAKVGGRSR